MSPIGNKAYVQEMHVKIYAALSLPSQQRLPYLILTLSLKAHSQANDMFLFQLLLYLFQCLNE